MDTSAVSTTRRTVLVALLLPLAFSMLWAALCNLTIEFLQTGGNVNRLITYTLGTKPWLFLLGAGFVWCIMLLLWAIVGRLWIATALLAALTVVVSYANYTKMTLRLEPLYPSDLSFVRDASFLGHMVGVGSLLAVLGFVGLVTAVIALAARVLRRHIPTVRRTRLGGRATAYAVRACVAVAVVTLLGYATHFNSTGNRVREVYEAADADWAFWYQRLNYFQNGFVGGFLYNMNVPAMVEPRGYSKEAMNAIAARYVDRATSRNLAADAHPLGDTNIVLVLSEAFSDPTRLKGVRYAEDPIPYTRHLMSETPSGTMLAQLFGGGTANMEFEALTGMSLSQFEPQMQSPYQMLIPGYQSFPSAVGLADSQGRTPIAVHPYMTSMYKREAVYPILGFQDFFAEKDMPDAKRLEKSNFISDASAFDEVLQQLNASKRPALINLVTMQNHFPMAGLYARPLPITGVSGDFKKEAEGYGRGLQYTDAALRDFIAELRDIDEPTAVVFYGDHQPAFWPESVREANGELAMHSTPFFFWANTPLKKQDLAAVTSPVFFLPLLYQSLGVELPPYYALLLDLYDELPAMEQNTYLSSTGQPVSPAELNPRAKQLLHDYRLVQYDLSIGRRYSQADLFYPQETSVSRASE
ncbi:MAG: LTA synthase family protein [Nocardioides sp.]